VREGRFERRRVTWCAVPGVAVAVALSWPLPWQLGLLAGWVVTASWLLVWIWSEIRGADAQVTRRIATREDDSRNAVRVVLVVASVTSLVAVVAALHRARSAPLGIEIALTVAAMSTVVVSWIVVNTLFTLRYAHLYYGGRVGGVDFPGEDPPSYAEFAYLAFTIGMTFQVSDTDITDPEVRATVLRHALLSYVFGTAIIASSINVLAGFVV
jgi:uncharacterized membrane protein